MEYLPLTIFNHKKKAEAAPYAIVNPIGTHDCVDPAASDVVMNTINSDYISVVKKLAIDPSKIASTARLFRAKGLGTVIFFTRELADKVKAAGFTGIEFVEIVDYKT